MKLSLTIETTDPAELASVMNAIAGVPTAAPATTTKSSRKVGSATEAMNAPYAGGTPVTGDIYAATATETTKQPAETPAATGNAFIDGPAKTETPAATEAVEVKENDLVAAANAAVAKLGGSGAAKVKAYIASNYKCDDGSPGTLKKTAKASWPALIADLQAIAAGTKSV